MESQAAMARSERERIAERVQLWEAVCRGCIVADIEELLQFRKVKV